MTFEEISAYKHVSVDYFDSWFIKRIIILWVCRSNALKTNWQRDDAVSLSGLRRTYLDLNLILLLQELLNEE